MKLIDKDVVVKEVERVLNSYHPTEITSGRYALANLRSFLDTLEVKEVDLDKEITDFINNYYTICFDDTTLQNDEFDFLTITDFEKIAKYFFELGLKVHKGE